MENKSFSHFHIKKIVIICIMALLLIMQGCENSGELYKNTDDNKKKTSQETPSISTPLISTPLISPTQILETSIPTTIKGLVVNGYIKDATVCVDENRNGVCSFDKIKTKTNEKGEYTLTFDAKPNTSYTIVASEGTYTSTNKEFNEIYRNVIKIEDNNKRAIQTLNITPITTLVAYLYNKEILTDVNYSISTAISKIGVYLGLEAFQISSNPLMSKLVFEKTQQIVQTVAILGSAIQADETHYNTKDALEFVMNKLSESVSKGEHQGGIDSSSLISALRQSRYAGRNVYIPIRVSKLARENIVNMRDKISISRSEDLAIVQAETQKSVTNITSNIISTNISDFSASAVPIKRVKSIGQLQTGQRIAYEANDDGTYRKGRRRSYSRVHGIVTDNITQLQWQDDSETSTIEKSYDDAMKYCQELTLNSFTDWKLPTIKELLGIVDYSQSSPSMDSVFTNTVSGYYWSATTNHASDSSAWLVSFDLGNAIDYTKSHNSYVRCVRGRQ